MTEWLKLHIGQLAVDLEAHKQIVAEQNAEIARLKAGVLEALDGWQIVPKTLLHGMAEAGPGEPYMDQYVWAKMLEAAPKDILTSLNERRIVASPDNLFLGDSQ